MRGHRQCTSEQKIERVDRWLISQGAKETGAIVALGLSADESERVKPNTDKDTLEWKKLAWPLLFEMSHPYTRQDCNNLIEYAGLPPAPSSACVYCPHHPLSYWQNMRINDPVQFWQMVVLEKLLGDRQVKRGQPRIFFTRT